MKTHWIILSSVIFAVLLLGPLSASAEISETGSSLQKLVGVAEQAEDQVVHASKAYARPILTIGIVAGVVLFLLGVIVSLLSKSFGEGVRNKALGIIGVTILGYLLISKAPEIVNIVNALINGVFH